MAETPTDSEASDALAGEHSVPLFWPLAATLGATDSWLKGLEFLQKATEIDHPAPAVWATPNTVRLDLKTMRLRAFGGAASGVPVIIDAPYAGHGATIADYDNGQSLVQALIAVGLGPVFVTDWKPATAEMSSYDIDSYLSDLNVAIDEVGGVVHLVGLCQGGWLSTMLAARFPQKVRTLVLAGSPIDTDAGNGPIKAMAHSLPLSAYQEMVRLGGGLMPGKLMLAGWKNMHSEEQYMRKYARLYEHMEDQDYIRRTGKFEAWYENPLDLPGTYYLQAISHLFKENRLAKGRFVGLGRTLNLRDVIAPTYLLAGEADDITTREQVFAAMELFGTPADQIVKQLVPGGHIGLFMGRRTLAEAWPQIGAWMLAHG